MTNKKMTKKDYFNQIKANYNLTDDEIAFVNHEIELLEKKNANKGDRKPTATQIANMALADTIYNAMDSGVNYTIGKMIKDFGLAKDDGTPLSTSKVSAVVRTQLLDNRVKRFEEKGKTYFVKVDEGE